ncbi:MAG: hypothetical protein K2I16_00155 [Muribaculaceae bacterium]|nr:hypothetical protein [Muribaculaceae bacterium]
MQPIKIAGLSVLALLWIWLSWSLLALGGVNLKNILLVAATGIIIFVPLWKKYIRKENK